MNNFKPVYKGQLEMASIRLVKDAPIMSENEIHNAGDAVKLLGEYLCEMDREVLCIINVKTNGIPINCSICSIGVIDQTIAQPRELLKTAILSNAAGMIIMHNHPTTTSCLRQVRLCWLRLTSPIREYCLCYSNYKRSVILTFKVVKRFTMKSHRKSGGAFFCRHILSENQGYF